MSVVDFNGNKSPWPPKGHQVDFNDKRQRSSLHVRCRELLRIMYPTQPILEEVPIPNMGLTCDFYLPFRKVVLECHGEQHYKFTPHFHKDRRGFAQSSARDMRKIEWCHMNNISVVVLPFSESDDEWRKRIEDADD